MKQQNILELAKIGAFFDDSIEFKNGEDISNITVTENVIMLNYNMNPYEKNEVNYPNFISMILGSKACL